MVDFAKDAVLFFRDGLEAELVADHRTLNVHLHYPEDVERFGGQSTGGQIAAKPTISFATAAPGRPLVAQEQITIQGVTYKLANIRKMGDGNISSADLNKG